MRVVLIGTYELGRQPFGLASPAAWLRTAGHDVRCVDVSRSPLTAEALDGAGLVAFHLPMHTATRLSAPLFGKVRRVAPSAVLCAYGLYAPVNEGWLRDSGVDVVIGPECEADLLALAEGQPVAGPAVLPRLSFRTPDRSGLPPLPRYARLRLPNGARRVTGYTEASRGCKHLCRHCPVVPVYQGQFRIVPVDVVIDDIAQQVEAGAVHVTFGDADFFNGPRHAIAVVEALARRFEGLTYDVTVKVEHVLRHADLLPLLRDTGCAFVTSAVESFDDEVLEALAKGHTGADARRAVALCEQNGVPLAPTFVAFTPWTTLRGYAELLGTVAALGLVDRVPSIQLALRLLVPAGSRLLELPAIRGLVAPFDAGRLVHPWTHPDPAVDALQRDVEQLVASRAGAPRDAVFGEVVSLAELYAGVTVPRPPDAPKRSAIPWLDEPWYC
ncbi:MAG: CUAEP/CCAEP-tail radical SAM protein [Vicinamibacterales bacterium]|nr:CUAEP/CCAEP-tail radical SAM protein [Vicinamibacterales bacterium]